MITPNMPHPAPGQTHMSARASLWDSLRANRLSEIYFRQNQRFGEITADFFAPHYHLIVSVNEPGVSSRHWFYAKQDAQLRHMGFRVLRFTAEEIERERKMALESIVEVVSRIAAKQRGQ